MNITSIKTNIFNENENLFNFIVKHISELEDKSVLVVTSKIVSLSEGKFCDFKDSDFKESLIQKESSWSIKTKHAWLTIRDGVLIPSAGIDESNANGKLILLPDNSYKSSMALRKQLIQHYKIKNLGVIISDSCVYPLRAGITGIALGYAGIKGIRDYRGKRDIFGNTLKISRTNIVDCLASAAVLEMGEANECSPLAIIKNAPVEFCETIDKNEVKIDIIDDLYFPFFNGKAC